MTTFREKDHLTLKMNITFFLIKNWMLTIFILNNFFEKAVFSEETAENRSGSWYLTIFQGKGASSSAKN